MPDAVAARVTLPSTLTGWRCNRRGCCCGGWRLLVTPSDVARLGAALGAGRVAQVLARAGGGPQVPGGAALFEPSGECPFLSAARDACTLHERFGHATLPDVCIDFPVFAYEGANGADFHFDLVCPGVLEAIVSGDGPVRAATFAPPWPDDATAMCAAHVRGRVRARVAGRGLAPELLVRIRDSTLDALADASRPASEHLLALDRAWSALERGAPPEDFRVDHDPRGAAEYVAFLRGCVGSWGVGTLVTLFGGYRRFLPPSCEPPAPGVLARHLEQWEEPCARWLEPQEEALRPVVLRYLAIRHFTPYAPSGGGHVFGPSVVAHVYGTALRYAAALAGALQRPVDAPLLGAAIGAAEYAHRAFDLPPAALPWCGA